MLFAELGPDRTRVDLTIEAEPEGAVETAGTALGYLDRRIAGDLDRFKAFIEDRAQPTGGWAGEIHGSSVTRS